MFNFFAKKTQYIVEKLSEMIYDIKERKKVCLASRTRTFGNNSQRQLRQKDITVAVAPYYSRSNQARSAFMNFMNWREKNNDGTEAGRENFTP